MSSAVAKKKAAQVAPAPAATTAPSGGVSLTKRLRAVNRWREQFNPVAGLNLQRARFLIESYARGEMADLQWTMAAPFMGIENSDPDLLALVERRTSAICQLDYGVKYRAQEDGGPKIDEGLAQEQKAMLREQYDGIDNLVEAFDALAMPTFRGFAHLEKYVNADGDVTHLEIVDQWNVVRDGMKGQWKYNPDAVMTSFAALPVENILPMEQFLYREVKRPVNRIALVKWIRSGLSDKDWDAFIEIYGIPGGIVIGPPNVPETREMEYEAAAKEAAEGGSGYLPNGSEYKPNDSPRGNNPFRDRLDYLSEKLILAGTGGLLTMLTAPGSGTLAGNAHQDTFDMLARAEARRITEVFQKGIDFPALERYFPAQPHLAYFELAGAEEQDIGEVVGHALKLAQAGLQVDPVELTERTGYTVTLRPAVDTSVQTAEQGDATARALLANRCHARVRNRAAREAQDLETFMTNCAATLKATDPVAFKPVIDRLDRIDQTEYATVADFQADLKKLNDELPQLAKQAGLEPDQLAAWQKIIGTGIANGLTEEKK